MTRDEWREIRRIAAAAWPERLDDERADFYFGLLQDLDATAVRRAMESLVREPREQIPAPGVIRARALGDRATSPRDTAVGGDSSVGSARGASVLELTAFAAGALLAAVAIGFAWAPFAGDFSLWDLGEQNVGLRLLAVMAPAIVVVCCVVGLMGSLLMWPGPLTRVLSVAAAATGGAVAGPALFFVGLPAGTVDVSLGGGLRWSAYLLLTLGGLLIAAGIVAGGFASWPASFATRLSSLMPMALISVAAAGVAGVGATKTWWEFDDFAGPTGFEVRVGKVLLGLVVAAGAVAVAAAITDLVVGRRASPGLSIGAAGLFGLSCGGFLASGSGIDPLLFTVDQGFVADVAVAPWLTAAASVTGVAVVGILVGTCVLAWHTWARPNPADAKLPTDV